MLVSSLVLVAVCLSITAVVTCFWWPRRSSATDSGPSRAASQLDAAIARQKQLIVIQRQRRPPVMVPLALWGIALLLLLTAMASDHFVHASVALLGAICTAAGLVIVSGRRRRR